jgi:hypothetical protein
VPRLGGASGAAAEMRWRSSARCVVVSLNMWFYVLKQPVGNKRSGAAAYMSCLHTQRCDGGGALDGLLSP